MSRIWTSGDRGETFLVKGISKIKDSKAGKGMWENHSHASTPRTWPRRSARRPGSGVPGNPRGPVIFTDDMKGR